MNLAKRHQYRLSRAKKFTYAIALGQALDQRQLVLPVGDDYFLPVPMGNHPVQEVPDWLRISKSQY